MTLTQLHGREPDSEGDSEWCVGVGPELGTSGPAAPGLRPPSESATRGRALSVARARCLFKFAALFSSARRRRLEAVRVLPSWRLSRLPGPRPRRRAGALCTVVAGSPLGVGGRPQARRSASQNPQASGAAGPAGPGPALPGSIGRLGRAGPPGTDAAWSRCTGSHRQPRGLGGVGAA